MPSSAAQVVRAVEAHPADAERPRRGRPATGSRSRTRSSRRRSRGIVPRPSTSRSGSPWSQQTTTPSGASTTPSIFWSRNWRARSSKRSAWRRRSRWASRRIADAGRRRAHDDEPPRLHQADRRGPVRGREHPLEHVVRDGVGPEAPDVPPLGDHPVDRGADVVGIAPAARVGGALGRPGGVEARRRRRADEPIRGDTRENSRVARRQRGGARNPVGFRDGRATVTGSPRSRESGTPSPRTLRVRDAGSRGGAQRWTRQRQRETAAPRAPRADRARRAPPPSRPTSRSTSARCAADGRARGRAAPRRRRVQPVAALPRRPRRRPG